MSTIERIKNRKSKDRGFIEKMELTGPEDFVYLKKLSMIELNEFQLSAVGEDGKVKTAAFAKMQSLLVALTVCDENRNLVFVKESINEGESPYDHEAVNEAFEVAAIQKIFLRAKELNGLNDKTKEEAAGNS
jgi:hypothetical protein